MAGVNRKEEEVPSSAYSAVRNKIYAESRNQSRNQLPAGANSPIVETQINDLADRYVGKTAGNPLNPAPIVPAVDPEATNRNPIAQAFSSGAVSAGVGNAIMAGLDIGKRAIGAVAETPLFTNPWDRKPPAPAVGVEAKPGATAPTTPSMPANIKPTNLASQVSLYSDGRPAMAGSKAPGVNGAPGNDLFANGLTPPAAKVGDVEPMGVVSYADKGEGNFRILKTNAANRGEYGDAILTNRDADKIGTNPYATGGVDANKPEGYLTQMDNADALINKHIKDLESKGALTRSQRNTLVELIRTKASLGVDRNNLAINAHKVGQTSKDMENFNSQQLALVTQYGKKTDEFGTETVDMQQGIEDAIAAGHAPSLGNLANSQAIANVDAIVAGFDKRHPTERKLPRLDKMRRYRAEIAAIQAQKGQ